MKSWHALSAYTFVELHWQWEFHLERSNSLKYELKMTWEIIWSVYVHINKIEYGGLVLNNQY